MTTPDKIDRRAMRAHNRSVVLELLRTEGPLARTEVADRTGLAKATVGSIVDGLLREGWVTESAGRPAAGRIGRPRTLLAFEAGRVAHLGVHVGVDATSVAALDGGGATVAVRSCPSVTGDPDTSVRDVARLARQVLRAAGVPRDRLANATVALPGLVDRHGHCTIAPNLGWRDVPVARRVGSALGVPTSAVNSTQASAYAESVEGVARRARSFVWLYVGSGIGSALMEDGQLVSGSRGFAGEIGHCRVSDGGARCRCGKRGCLEVFAATPAIVAAARSGSRRRPGGAPATVGEVATAARDGDLGARRALRDAGRWLGLGTSYLVSILNPELVVLGGEASVAADLLLGSLCDALAADALTAEQVPVVVTSVPGDPALRGAGLLALHGAPAARVGSTILSGVG